MQILAAVSMIVSFLYLIFSGRATDELIFKILLVLTGLTNGINGVALHMRNSSGKRWTDPQGEKQDQLPMQPAQHDERMQQGDDSEGRTP